MDFKTQVPGAGGMAGVAADALLVVVAGEAAAAALDAPIAAVLKSALAEGDFKFEPGRALYLHHVVGVKAARLVLAAGGDGSPAAFRKGLAAGLSLLKAGGTRTLAVALAAEAAPTEGHAEVLAVAANDAAYLYRATKPSAKDAPKLQSVRLVCAKAQAAALETGLARGAAIAEGVTLARELANRPANHCTPSDLAAEAKRLAKAHALKVEVLDRKDAEKLGMGAFLAVAQGTEQPPKFIVLKWHGAGKGDPPVVLIGKGITFDTGGISLKPAAEMDEMKFDMGGAASVLGALRAVAALELPLNVIGLIPATENMPGGRAVKPGDVVKSLSGQTIEILNTDAEGRLVLCDAMTYAERFEPAAVVDIATLTGACVVALGHHRTGLFSNDDTLAAELLAAGSDAHDPAWRMPLDDEYDEALKSNFADMANVGPRAGGAVTAAKFLQRYARKLRWAHLDIAGTAWRTGKEKGATGRPVPLLVHFLLARAGRAGPR